jgi:hypothetical protein
LSLGAVFNNNKESATKDKFFNNLGFSGWTYLTNCTQIEEKANPALVPQISILCLITHSYTLGVMTWNRNSKDTLHGKTFHGTPTAFLIYGSISLPC